MKRVIPVAEEYHVTMALHPDDPPVKSLSGIARMFIDLDSYKRAEAMIDSPNWVCCSASGLFPDGGRGQEYLRRH